MDTNGVRRRLDAEERRWKDMRDSLLATRVRDTEEHDWVGELDRAGQHPADLASETTERELDFGLLEEAETMLDEVTQARGRLDAGTYGVCQTCGKRIPAERLAAVPATRYCVTHERALEPRWATGAVGGHERSSGRHGAPVFDATTAASRRMRSGRTRS